MGQRKLAQQGPWYEIKAETGTSKPRPWIAGPRFSQTELGGKSVMGNVIKRFVHCTEDINGRGRGQL